MKLMRKYLSSGLQEEEHKLKEGEETSQLIKDHMLYVAQQVTEHFAKLDVMYADLIKKVMAVNEARNESLKHFPWKLRQWICNSFDY